MSYLNPNNLPIKTLDEFEIVPNREINYYEYDDWNSDMGVRYFKHLCVRTDKYEDGLGWANFVFNPETKKFEIAYTLKHILDGYPLTKEEFDQKLSKLL